MRFIKATGDLPPTNSPRHNAVKTITIDNLRQRWPEVEAALQVAKEILTTRNGHSVAKLVRITGRESKRIRRNREKSRSVTFS
jgi:antitoxin (DNA-binding transcriptional repressor) of toxin-antitoxin stability system